MNLAGLSPLFKTHAKQQIHYQKELINQVATLISCEVHIVVMTELNTFWLTWLKDRIPSWGFVHDGRDVAMMYQTTVCN